MDVENNIISNNENLGLRLDVTEETPLYDNDLSEAESSHGDKGPNQNPPNKDLNAECNTLEETSEKTLLHEDSSDFDELEVTEETADSPEESSSLIQDSKRVRSSGVLEESATNILNNDASGYQPTTKQVTKSVIIENTSNNEKAKENKSCDNSNSLLNGVSIVSKSLISSAGTNKRKLAASENAISSSVNGIDNSGKRSKLDLNSHKLGNTIIEPEREPGKTTARKSIASSIAKSLKKGIRIFDDERHKEEARRRNNANTSAINCEKHEKIASLNGVVMEDVTRVKTDEDVSIKEEKNLTEKERLGNDSPSRSTCLNADSLSDELLKNVFQRLRKGLSRRQLEEIVLQKLCELVSENGQVSELRRLNREISNAESLRKETAENLKKQICQLQSVCRVFTEKMSTLPQPSSISRPTIITRNVGLQVAIDSLPFVRADRASNDVSVSNERSQNQSTSTAQSNFRSNQNSSKIQLNSSSKPLERRVLMSARLRRTISPSQSLPTTSNSRNSDGSLVLERRNSCQPGRSKLSSPVVVDALIDLTEKDDKSNGNSEVSTNASCSNIANLTSSNAHLSSKTPYEVSNFRHTSQSQSPIGTKPLPAPNLQIFKDAGGISLSWDMPDLTSDHANISKYQIYAYQQGINPTTNQPWRFVGDVNALPLPMSCVLTQFIDGFTYYIRVRAVDVHDKKGPFSSKQSVKL